MKRHKYVKRLVLEEHDVICNWCGTTCTDAYCLLATCWEWSMGTSEAHLCSDCYEKLASLFSIEPSYDGNEHIINEDELSLEVQQQEMSQVTVTNNNTPGVVYVYGHTSSSVVQLGGSSSYSVNEGSD